MADIQWPAGLRNSIVAAKRVDRPGGFREVSVAAGPAFVEPFSDDTPTFFDVTFRFTRTEARVFDAWIFLHKHNTEAPFFDFPIVIPDSQNPEQEARFVGRPPQRVAQAQQTYTYQGRILVRQIASIDESNAAAVIQFGEVFNYVDIDESGKLLDTAINTNYPSV